MGRLFGEQGWIDFDFYRFNFCLIAKWKKWRGISKINVNQTQQPKKWTILYYCHERKDDVPSSLLSHHNTQYCIVLKLKIEIVTFCVDLGIESEQEEREGKRKA